MKNTIPLAAVLLFFCGCMSYPNSFEKQPVKAGELAERAVAEKFPDIPPDALRWAEVSWYSTRSSETAQQKIYIISKVLDIRTLQRDSYYAPRVKIFRVKLNKELDIISVELDSDGILKGADGSDEVLEIFPEYEMED